MTWRAPTLSASEQVAIAVGNQLRLANARFDLAIRHFGPQTIFQEMMADLDDLDPQWEEEEGGLSRVRRHLSSGYLERENLRMAGCATCSRGAYHWPSEAPKIRHREDCPRREELW